MPTQLLKRHLEELKSCRRCPNMHPAVVVGEPALSKVMLIGQAPGVKEPVLQRPFAWTAGKTLFRWFYESAGLEEAHFRKLVYMAAVCRCYPGKNPKGGDRVPDAEEIENCADWMESEMRILKPSLVLPVGKLAILQFLEFKRLTEVIGKSFTTQKFGQTFDLIP
ncbi:MAG: uracil-DNA glycosylase, partial [Verrucomicrobiae bacterium]|nr:uracil-DNA glycosylase [Verrucomicrobiae bacterium]